MQTTIVLVLVVLLVLWLGQRWMIYFPEREVPAPRLVQLPDAEAVAFSTEDDLRLEGWFVRPAAPPTGQTVIIFNGNGGNRAYRAPLAAALADRGHAVLLFDYRGYGGNPGLPSERGLQRDARAALAAVAGRDDVDPERIVYYGESLGAAVAVQLATEHPPHALILRSPFTSLPEIGQHHYPFLPVRWLLRDRYPSIDRITSLRTPLLVIAAADDRIVPAEMSEQLYEAAPEPKWLITIEDADHNDVSVLAGPELISAVAKFLDGVRQQGSRVRPAVPAGATEPRPH
jgi:fermentation-respiration switch protein FrsA (DUF1100 family)